MDKFKSRIQLYWANEFAAEYIARLKHQADRAARAVGRKYGPEAEAEIRENIGRYISYSLFELTNND